MENVISLNVQPSIVEVWYEGSIKDGKGKEHYFWLVDPEGKDDFEVEVRWFYKNVPREIRAMYVTIIELYKKEKYGRGTD